MLQEPPENYKKAVESVLNILEKLVPSLLELSTEGVKLTLPEGYTETEFLLFLEEMEPGITENLELMLGAGRHPER